MLDVTGGELLVLVGAAAIFLGKKEVPQLARMAGRGTGKMVALLNTAREQFTKATQDTQLSKLHDEVRQNMYELHSIRSELRSAGLAPGARPTAGLSTPAAAAASARLQSASVPPLSAANQPPRMVAPPVVPPPMAAVPEAAALGAAAAGAGGGGSARLGELAMAEILLQESDAQAGGAPRAAVAAATASALPQGAPPSGADVVEDVILETLIRDHVDRFSQGQKGGGGGQK